MCAHILVFVIRHGQRMRRIILSFVDRLAVLYLSHYLLNGTICGKSLLNVKHIFKFSPRHLSQTFLVLRRIQPGVVMNVRRSSCRAPGIHVIF